MALRSTSAPSPHEPGSRNGDVNRAQCGRHPQAAGDAQPVRIVFRRRARQEGDESPGWTQIERCAIRRAPSAVPPGSPAEPCNAHALAPLTRPARAPRNRPARCCARLLPRCRRCSRGSSVGGRAVAAPRRGERARRADRALGIGRPHLDREADPDDLHVSAPDQRASGSRRSGTSAARGSASCSVGSSRAGDPGSSKMRSSRARSADCGPPTLRRDDPAVAA